MPFSGGRHLVFHVKHSHQGHLPGASKGSKILKYRPQEIARTLIFRIIKNQFWWPLLHNNSFIHEDHMIGHLTGKTHLVCHHHHRHTFLGKLAHDLEHLADQLRIERRSGFVKEHEFGVHGERTSNSNALLLAAGELVRIDMGFLDEANFVKQDHSALSYFSPRLMQYMDWRLDHILQGGHVREEVKTLK